MSLIYQYAHGDMAISVSDTERPDWHQSFAVQDEFGNDTPLWTEIKDNVERGDIVIAAADPLPDPGPTQAEQVDALVASGTAALAAATTLPEVKAVFASTLVGLGDLLGTSGGG